MRQDGDSQQGAAGPSDQYAPLQPCPQPYPPSQKHCSSKQGCQCCALTPTQTAMSASHVLYCACKAGLGVAGTPCCKAVRQIVKETEHITRTYAAALRASCSWHRDVRRKHSHVQHAACSVHTHSCIHISHMPHAAHSVLTESQNLLPKSSYRVLLHARSP